jgi:hypothetical protein
LKESIMLATGGLLVCLALLALAAVAPVFRRSNPPEWTTRGWVGEVITLAIVCTLALGLGYLGAGVIGAVQTGVGYLDLGLLAAVLLVSVGIWRRLRTRTRPGALGAEALARAQAPESGQVHGEGLVARAEPAPLMASAPPPPHRAA